MKVVENETLIMSVGIVLVFTFLNAQYGLSYEMVEFWEGKKLLLWVFWERHE